MPANLDIIFIIGSILVLLAVMVSKVSERFGIPILLLFLALGMLAGSEGLGGIYFDDPELTQWISTVALAIILFSGGMDTNWQSIQPVFKAGFSLATIGVLLTAGLMVSLSICFLIWNGPYLIIRSHSFLYGCSRGVFLLRSKGVSLKGNLKPLLELESGSNDRWRFFSPSGSFNSFKIRD